MSLQWLNNEFLENYLRNYFNDNQLKVDKFTTNAAVPNGEHFRCRIYRVSINFTNDYVSYCVVLNEKKKVESAVTLIISNRI